MTHPLKRGYTLLEMAIVIVIIGFAVTGILVGRSLVDNSRVARTIVDYGSFNLALNTFFQKYDALPGDMNTAAKIWGEVSPGCTIQRGTGTQTCNGNGNRQVEYDRISVNAYWEGVRFWQHLANAKLIKGSFTGSNIAGCAIADYLCYKSGENVPETPIDGTLWGFWYLDEPKASWRGKDVNRHAFAIGSNKLSSSTGRWHQASLTAKQAETIDKKTDDGKPKVGKVVVMGATGTYETTNCHTTDSNPDNVKYKISTKGPACILLLDSSLGSI